MRRIEPDRNFVPDTIMRMGIDEWRALRREDPEGYRRELFDRPARFDAGRWRRAIREWRNEIPRETEGPLAGVPVVVKDLFDIRGEVTGCGSRLFLQSDARGHAVATEDAWIVDLFRRLGASVVGRSQMNEFAYGLDGFNAYTGDCPHPFDPGRISGGSSSGSAWSVAAGVAPIALGTDTGGSIRLPAAMCGIYGFRAQHDEEMSRGAFPLAHSFDTVGWFTTSPEDMTVALGAFLAEIGRPPEVGAAEAAGRAIAVLPPGVTLGADMARAWGRIEDILAGVGFEVRVVREADQRLGDRALDAYNVIGSSEAWAVHEEWMDRYREYYTPVVWALIDRGRRWSEERVADAEKAQRAALAYAAELFEEADCIVLPATPRATPRREEASGDFRSQVLRLNTLGSFSGLSALSLPLRFGAIRSGGIQVLCRRGEEYRYLPLLSHWERAINL